MRKRRRVPFIEQMEHSECGICCLAMILDYYHCYVPLLELREKGGAGRDGVNLLSLRNIARGYGLEAYGQRTEVDKGAKLAEPCILHWENNHFVVLERLTGSRAIIVDPAIGRRSIPLTEFREKYSGALLVLRPTKQLAYRKKRPLWIDYMKLLSQHTPSVTKIIVWSLWIQMLALVAPISIRFLIDEVIVPRETGILTAVGVGFASLSVIHLVFLLLRSRTLVTLQNHLDWNLMSTFFYRMLSLPYKFFQLRSTGDLIVRANSNMMLRDILSTRTVTALLDGGMVVFFLLFMLDRSPSLTGWVVVTGMIQVIILLATRNKIKQLAQEQILKQTLASNSFVETIRGITDVKAGGIEKLAYARWEQLYKEQLASVRKRGILEANVASLVDGLRFAAPLVLLWIGTKQVISYQMTLGELFAFFTLAAAFLTPLTALVTSLNQMIVMGAYLNRILDIHESKVEQDDSEVQKPPSLKGKVELRNVSFGYHTESPEVIRKVSVTINPGQKIAIVGASGSGKSTLAGLLLGLYLPTEGEVFFDDQNLTLLDKPALRNQIGVVMQNTFIFNRSIAENIAIHDPTLTMKQIVEVAKMAGIHDEIMQMPLNYQTLISEGGTNLSGGQRQRIALARALTRNPAIILLDEATSALDTLTERTVEQNLSGLQCTRIVIAHRHSTIVNADLILVLEGGSIKEAGSHQELLAGEGYYASLYKQLQPT
ncbi:peptidase domain-containing ABC transporter [Paenibacillus ferrarius]|uniref:peptidase domain-containing ABC transporter n=1 Tax=Paenibacillus ferrarius TaxID=1469647 RepID=UPI003D2E093D